MAAGLNKVTLIGHLGQDPEVRYTQSGTAVCTLRLAVTERRKDGDSWADHTEWFSAVCFGKTAENAGRFLKKGRQIFAEGRLQTRNWEDREGNKRTSVEVVCNQVLFLGGGRDNVSGGSFEDTKPAAQSSNGPSSFGAMDSGSDFMEDDIPF